MTLYPGYLGESAAQLLKSYELLDIYLTYFYSICVIYNVKTIK
jgi:hypothetical protein